MVVLGEALIPPDGYEAEVVVAATYSLDLPAALSIPLALIRQGQFAGESLSRISRWSVLEAIRRFAPKYRVFCDAGCIAPPPRDFGAREALAEMIVPVAPGNVDDGRPSFHPKFVLVRYSGRGKRSLHRLVCMSRNLANAASFDVGIVLHQDGEKRTTKAQHGGDLAAAVKRLADWIVKPEQFGSTSSLLEDMARTVGQVRWMAPPGFKDVALWPIGFGRGSEGSRPDPMVIRDEEQRLLIVSPFLGAGRLETLTGSSDKANCSALVSTNVELQRVGRTALGRFGRIFEFEPEIGFDTPIEHDGGPDPAQLSSGLHAKVYIAEREDESRWVVGSANATSSSVGGNVEMMVELWAHPRKHGIDAQLGEKGFGDLLHETDDHVAEDRNPAPLQDRTAEHVLTRLADQHVRGVVTKKQDGSYSLEVNLSEVPVPGAEEVDITAGLSGNPTSQMRADRNPAVRFDGLELTELTRFLIVRVTAPSATVTRTVGISLDGVDEKEFADALWAKEAKEGGDPMDYIASVLEEGDYGLDVTIHLDDEEKEEEEEEPEGPGGNAPPYMGRPLLERLLALTRDDSDAAGERLAELARVINTFSDRLPTEFLDMWKSVEEAYEGERG